MGAKALPPKIPVKAVFRKTPPLASGSALSGLLAKEVSEQFNKPQIMAILPYQPLAPGLKGNNMVAMVAEGGERLITHYRTIITNTIPAEFEDYKHLLSEMENLGGYDVEVIQATQIDHALRRAERVKADDHPGTTDDDDHEIVSEPVEIRVDIVNDDVDADSFGSDTFKEEWA